MATAKHQSVNSLNVLSPQFPLHPNQAFSWQIGSGLATALAMVQTATIRKTPIIALTPDMQTAWQLHNELQFFAEQSDLPILSFPDWETLPYDLFAPLPEIISQRLEALYRLPSLQQGILILPVNTLMQRLPPKQYLQANTFMLDIGDQLNINTLRKQLETGGYTCVVQVTMHGEYAIRGSIFDLFPMGHTVPFRIELFDDEVETIRTFNPEDQRSLAKVDHIRLLPAREFPFDDAARLQFREAYQNMFPLQAGKSIIFRDVNKGNLSGGLEYYLPLFFKETQTLFDYLPKNCLIIEWQTIKGSADEFFQQVQSRYEQHRHDPERPLLAPEQLFIHPDEIRANTAKFAQIELFANGDTTCRTVFQAPKSMLPKVGIDVRLKQPDAELVAFLANFDGRVLFTAESTGQREVLLDLLTRFGIKPQALASWRDFCDTNTKLAITIASIEHGIVLSDAGLAVIPQVRLYADRVSQSSRDKTPERDPDAIIRNFTELTIGAPVVHQDHGVGRYLGLQKIEIDAVATEFLALEYAAKNKLYVPVAALHMISRYTGVSPENAPLHKLGGTQWQRVKQKACERIRDVAAELLEIYAKREAKAGMQSALDEIEYSTFSASFAFEETPDQMSAIAGVKQDMLAARPMDRVICGDVGFGKTEVALRAVFIAINNQRQVAVLVPTTLLAQQHFQNFSDRFADWPVNIESLSRFRTKKQQDEVLKGLADGKVDIVIGTHKLIQKDVVFANLGLVIIDEEHRFGVRQKERFKALRSEVDLLTMTATPIPRTLHMSMSGLRDLSIIATPPAHRHAVKTHIGEWNDMTITDACMREIKRGGQIYVLYNEVKTIARMERQLNDLLPNVQIRIAHGQMRERELESIMLDFYHRRFSILLCTTIIESGIDVPNANTIIINRADKFGLAQLHQLRGRVGRSHHRAYAYLIIPPQQGISKDALKRLNAIESLDKLGAGFTLATHDMEIRGAGEMLGEEQSGQIHEIGFNLYTELLQRAVAALKSGQQPELNMDSQQGPEVDMRISSLLPDDYIADVHTRLVMYKRIANANDAATLRGLQVELIERFGLLPEHAKNLFRLTEMKLFAEPLGICKIEGSAACIRLLFNEKPNVDTVKLIRMMQSQPDRYKLTSNNCFCLYADLTDAACRFNEAEALLHMLAT